MFEYDIVDSCDYEQLVSFINERMRLGWHCQGGVCVMAVPNPGPCAVNPQYFQAMVRKVVSTDRPKAKETE